jgi:hypothetical protein
LLRAAGGTGAIRRGKEILFEGYTEDEIWALPKEHVNAIILTGETVVFRAGSATILGEFRVEGNRLRIELAQIEGGREGVLLLGLGALARRFALRNGISAVEWIVHAVHCAKPTLKLRRVLERRGFVVSKLPSIDEAYYKLEEMTDGPPTKTIARET